MECGEEKGEWDRGKKDGGDRGGMGEEDRDEMAYYLHLVWMMTMTFHVIIVEQTYGKSTIIKTRGHVASGDDFQMIGTMMMMRVT